MPLLVYCKPLARTLAAATGIVQITSMDGGPHESRIWGLAKGVPAALLLALVLQTIAFVWFLAGLNNRVENQGVALIAASLKLDVLTATVVANAIPQAQTQWRIDNLERIVHDVSKRDSDRKAGLK